MEGEKLTTIAIRLAEKVVEVLKDELIDKEDKDDQGREKKIAGESRKDSGRNTTDNNN